MRSCCIKNILACILVILSSINKSSGQQNKDRQLVVAIVAVSNFDDPQFQSPLLQQAIHSTSDQLEMFFKNKFPQAKIFVRKEHDETKADSLREFFRSELLDAANGNVTLLFIISHGRSLPYPNTILGHDLKIIASDTPPDKLQAKSVSLGSDVLGQLQNLQPGSLVFAFVDTCYSGAAAGLALDVDTALRTALGVKMMLMTSALSDQEMIQATFSQSLLDLWTDSAASGCTVPEASKDTIREKIQKQLQGKTPPIVLGTNEGYPDVVIHFPGLFCLESFGTINSIATIFNATGDSYIASFTDTHGREHREPLSSHQVSPVMLAREKYSLSYFRNNAQVGPTKTLDLSAMPFYWDLIGTPDRAQLGLAFERAGTIMGAAGFGKEAKDLQERAYASYVLAKDTVNAQRLAGVLSKVPSVDASWHFAQNLAFKQYSTVTATIQAKNIDYFSAARELQSVGDLHTSAMLLNAVTDTEAASTDITFRDAVAQEAYFAYAGSGDYKAAQQIRKKFKLTMGDCTDCIKIEASAIKGNSQAVMLLNNISTTKILTEPIKQGWPNSVLPSASLDWEKHIDWALTNSTGASEVDCPLEYLQSHSECLLAGGRTCLMKAAVQDAIKGDCGDALRLSLITQCHNSRAQVDLQAAGTDQVCSYLKQKRP